MKKQNSKIGLSILLALILALATSGNWLSLSPKQLLIKRTYIAT